MSVRLLLQKTSITFQSDNFTRRIHYCGICGNRSPDGISRIIHVDNNYLGGIANLLSDANKFIRFHSKCVKADIVSVNSNSCKL